MNNTPPLNEAILLHPEDPSGVQKKEPQLKKQGILRSSRFLSLLKRSKRLNISIEQI